MPRSGGWYYCEYTDGDGLTYDWQMVENFYVQPFSNLTDWDNPPHTSFSLTVGGQALFTSENFGGYSIPTVEFSPGIYAQIKATNKTRMEYPRFTLIKTDRWDRRYDAYVNSRGYSNTDCSFSVTLTHDSLINDVGAAAGSLIDWFDFCGLTRLC